MFYQKIAAVALSVVMTLGTLTSAGVSAVPAKDQTMRDISTMELVRDMGIGINLGNTFEACGDWIAQWSDGSPSAYETAWGSPVVTREMIEGMANEGFGVVRVPVAWSNMMANDGQYQINDQYAARVMEVVDWVLDADMYCIINIHWDNGWVNTFPDNKDECMRRYEIMWTQIAAYFQDYGDHLMFESQNEELGWESIWNPWSGTDAEKQLSYALANEINQKFVDVIRSSGGNNPQRHLLISGYNTGFDRTCDPYFRMPNDPANRMAVSVHYYTPAGFAILEDKDESWAKARSTWGTDADFAELNQQMDMMKTNYIDRGIPVIVGEYGCPTKGKDPASVRLFLSSVCKAAYDRQLCPVLWATPDGHYDRENACLYDQELKKTYNEIVGFDPSQRVTEPVTEEPTTPPGPAVGDVDQNGTVELLDLVKLQRHLHGSGALTQEQFRAADLDGDGSVDVFDLALLKRSVLHS